MDPGCVLVNHRRQGSILDPKPGGPQADSLEESYARYWHLIYRRLPFPAGEEQYQPNSEVSFFPFGLFLLTGCLAWFPQFGSFGPKSIF